MLYLYNYETNDIIMVDNIKLFDNYFQFIHTVQYVKIDLQNINVASVPDQFVMNILHQLT